MMQAVQAMVQQAMQYIDKTPDVDSKIELIKTLNNVSAGKVIIVLNVFLIFPIPYSVLHFYVLLSLCRYMLR